MIAIYLTGDIFLINQERDTVAEFNKGMGEIATSFSSAVVIIDDDDNNNNFKPHLAARIILIIKFWGLPLGCLITVQISSRGAP